MFHGVQLYGAIDLGGGWQSHAAPFNSYYPQGVEYAITKNSNKSLFVASPGGLGYNNIGLRGQEPLVHTETFGDVKLVFDMNSSFDPYSLQWSNGAKTLIQANGTVKTQPQLGDSTSNGDSARNGQIFNDFAYAGLSSSTLGTVTFGRQRTFATDDFKNFDPQGGALAFSLLGYSSALNGGATEATRLDQSLKYVFAYDWFHTGAIVQLGDFAEYERGGKGTYQFQFGGNIGDFSFDIDEGHVSGATTLNYYTSNTFVGSSILANYLSDDDQLLVAGKYRYGAFTFFGGYEWFKISNPSVSAPTFMDTNAGYGGYTYTKVYVTPKVEQLVWTGVDYAVTRQLDVIGGLTYVKQNAYQSNSFTGSTLTQAKTGGKATLTKLCATTTASNCAGSETALSLALDYHYAKNLEFYGGVMFTQVTGGLASGFLYSTELDPTIGVRYTF